MKTSDYTTETLWEALLDARTKLAGLRNELKQAQAAYEDVVATAAFARHALAETRALLETATDAWLDGGQLWPDSPLYAPYKWSALSEDWYKKARKLITDETAS